MRLIALSGDVRSQLAHCSIRALRSRFLPCASIPQKENRAFGELSEWFMVAVLKTVRCNSLVGSNPTLAAKVISRLVKTKLIESSSNYLNDLNVKTAFS